MTKSDPKRRDVVVNATRLAGLMVPSEDVDALCTALNAQNRRLADLEQLDLRDVEPTLTFDPRWE